MRDSSEVEERRAERIRRRDWRRNSGVFSHRHSRAGRLFFAVFLIIAGVFLFLDNVGVLRLRNIWLYSPLLFVAWGVSVLSEARSMTRWFWGIFMMAFGVLGLLLNLGVLRLHTRDGSWVLALLLIAFGFLALVKTIESGSTPKLLAGLPQSQAMPSDNVLNEHTVAGSIKRRLETPNFLGGEIDCVFGSVELDLRHSQIASNEKPVIIDVSCVFGSTKMRVPDTWIVVIQAAGVFGSVEDKTIPPRTTNGLTAATVIVRGQSVFSSVEVEN